MNKLFGDKKAISPVIATVILVAVTIVVAVAVAYWMGSIAGLYTRFEKVEITNAYATYSDQVFDGGWTVTVNLRNTGTADATITGLLINGKPYGDYNPTADANVKITEGLSGTTKVITSSSDFNTKGLPIVSGQDGKLVFEIKKGVGPFNAGVSIEIKLHTAGGNDYPKMITLT